MRASAGDCRGPESNLNMRKQLLIVTLGSLAGSISCRSASNAAANGEQQVEAGVALDAGRPRLPPSPAPPHPDANATGFDADSSAREAPADASAWNTTPHAIDGGAEAPDSAATRNVSPDSGSTGPLRQPETTTDVSSTSEPVVPALYKAHCASCHGVEGRGKSGQAPEIQHPVNDYALWIIRTGRKHPTYLTGMPAFDEHLAPDSQVVDVLTYLHRVAQPTTGKGLFLDYCANCHGADARGGTTGRSLIGLSGAFEESVRQGRNLNQMGSRSNYMPRWKTSEVSEAEVSAMADYVGLLENTAK